MDFFILYRNTECTGLIETLKDMNAGNRGEEKYSSALTSLLNVAYRDGFEGNLWWRLLTESLVYDENPYTLSCERRPCISASIREAAMEDMELFFKLFKNDPLAAAGLPDGLLNYSNGGRCEKYNPVMTSTINKLSESLGYASSVTEMTGLIEDFYEQYGVGIFGLHKAFRVKGDSEDSFTTYPILNIAVTSLSDLVGYDDQKALLRNNTESFLNGGHANNCLLYGDSGTGKSSSIRAILNEYYNRGLRMIEVYKHQYKEINTLIDQLKNRNYRFIIYMDDLSFEEFEVEYKYLKAVLEGGLESRPENVLIYATSNRKHLVRENFSDREERDNDKHSNETVQEKLSLYTRFGLPIYYGAPEQQEYYRIVKELAKRYSIPLSEDELILAANRWEISHGGFSGRTAAQFIDDVRSRTEHGGEK